MRLTLTLNPNLKFEFCQTVGVVGYYFDSIGDEQGIGFKNFTFVTTNLYRDLDIDLNPIFGTALHINDFYQPAKIPSHWTKEM